MPTLSTSDASIPTQAASTSAWERGGSIPWERDLLTLFVRNQIRVVLALPLLAVLYASVSLLWTTPLQSAAWLLTACGCQAIQYFLCKQYLDNADARGSQTDWVGMLTASEFLVAAAWSLPLFLFWDTGTHLQHLYLVATVMAVIAVRIMIAANFMPIIIAGTGFMTFNVAI